MIVTDDRVAAFVAKACGVVINPPYTAVGIEKGGAIVAGVIFNNYTGADIHLTAAGRGWGKHFIADVGRYVFQKLRCERITIITEKPYVSGLSVRLGGRIEGVLKNHFGKGRDAQIIGILAEDWRY